MSIVNTLGEVSFPCCIVLCETSTGLWRLNVLVRTPTAPQLGPFPASCTVCSDPGPSVTPPGSLVVHSPLDFQHLFSCRTFGIPSNSRVSPLHQSCTAGLSTRAPHLYTPHPSPGRSALLPASGLLTSLPASDLSSPLPATVFQLFFRLQVFQDGLPAVGFITSVEFVLLEFPLGVVWPGRTK